MGIFKKKKSPMKETGALADTEMKENVEEPNSTVSPPSNPIFGVPLATAYRNAGGHMPEIVRQCISFIENYGLDVEGIYRIPGAKSKVVELQTRVNNGETVNLDAELPHSGFGVHNVCSLLSSFFRELPDALIPASMETAFQTAVEVSSSEARRTAVKNLLRTLPKQNIEMLALLCRHIVTVSEHESENLMGLRNLTVVLGSCIKPRKEFDSLDEARASRENGDRSDIMMTLLQDCDALLGEWNPSNAAAGASAVSGTIGPEISVSGGDDGGAAAEKRRIAADIKTEEFALFTPEQKQPGRPGALLDGSIDILSPSFAASPATRERVKQNMNELIANAVIEHTVAEKPAGNGVETSAPQRAERSESSERLQAFFSPLAPVFSPPQARSSSSSSVTAAAPAETKPSEHAHAPAASSLSLSPERKAPAASSTTTATTTATATAGKWTKVEGKWTSAPGAKTTPTEPVAAAKPTETAREKPVEPVGGKLAASTSTPISEKSSPESVSERVNPALNIAMRRLQTDRERRGRPTELSLMSLAQMKDEKDAIKRELRAYDRAYVEKLGRNPTKAEKEPMRPLYQRYKELKAVIDQAAHSSSTSAATSAALEPPKSVSMSIASDSSKSVSAKSVSISSASHSSKPETAAKSIAKSPYATPSTTTTITTTTTTTTTRDTSRPDTAPLSPMDDSTGGDESVPRSGDGEIDWKAIKHEKRELQRSLHEYQETFMRKHGRKVKYRSDRQPMEAEYQRYKFLRQLLQEQFE